MKWMLENHKLSVVVGLPAAGRQGTWAGVDDKSRGRAGHRTRRDAS